MASPIFLPRLRYIPYMKTPVPLIAVVVCLPSLSLMARDFKVLVLDAVNGKPQSNMHVNFFCQDSRRNYSSEEDDTDDQGVIVVPYGCKGDEAKIAIDVTGLPKEQCGGSVIAAFEEISSTGIISAPDAAGEMHCTTKISRKLKPVPGQVFIFVKKPSWWQSHF